MGAEEGVWADAQETIMPSDLAGGNATGSIRGGFSPRVGLFAAIGQLTFVGSSCILPLLALLNKNMVDEFLVRHVQ